MDTTVNTNTRKIDKLRWLMVIAMMLVGMTSAYINAISAYIGPFTEKGWDPTIVVIAYSVMTFMSLPGSIVGGALKAKFGNKLVLKVGGLGFALTCIATVFITSPWAYVVLMGGVTPFFVYCVYVVQMANIGELFPDRAGLATGLFVAGIGVASALILPLTEWLTRTIDVMYGIGLSGIVYGGFTVLIGFIMIDAPKDYKPEGWTPQEYEILDEEKAEKTDSDKNVNWMKMMIRPAFWMVYIGEVCFGVLSSGLYSNFIVMVSDLLGVSSSTAAWLYSLFTLVMGGSGIVLGYISDKLFGPTKSLAICCLLTAAAIGLFLATGGNSYVLFVAFIVIAGMALGSVQALTPNIMMMAWGNKYFGINYGIMLTTLTVGSFIGPQLAVRFSMIEFLGVAGILMVVAAVLIFASTVFLNRDLGKKVF